MTGRSNSSESTQAGLSEYRREFGLRRTGASSRWLADTPRLMHLVRHREHRHDA
jgi:hypothetical protein